jgi:hypothetical protein
MRTVFFKEIVGVNLKHRFYLGVLAIVSVLALLPGPVAAAGTVTLVATGLDNPRGIAFVGGTAVVAEAGHGSSNPADCFTGPAPFPICVGNTSKISWVNTTTGAHTPLASGFFSISLGPEGSIGVSGLSVRGGKIYAQIGATGREVPPQFAIGHQAGNLISVNPTNGNWTLVSTVGNNDFDYTTQFTQPNPPVCGQCPGTQEHDANPTGVLATADGIYVADSGANTLTRVAKNGSTKVLAHFPWRDPNFHNFPSDEVPTCVAGSDEALWIGTLSGHLYRFEEGRVTQVTPKDSAGKALLSHVTGCTSKNGTLYIVNMFGAGTFGDQTFFNGSVVTYNTESGKGSLLTDAVHNPTLFLPYMDAIGPDGNLYVTSGTVCNADGTSAVAPASVCSIGGPGGRLVKISLPRGGED